MHLTWTIRWLETQTHHYVFDTYFAPIYIEMFLPWPIRAMIMSGWQKLEIMYTENLQQFVAYFSTSSTCNGEAG